MHRFKRAETLFLNRSSPLHTPRMYTFPDKHIRHTHRHECAQIASSPKTAGFCMHTNIRVSCFLFLVSLPEIHRYAV